MPRWLAVALCFLALPAWAQEAELGMVTGDKTGTYYAFGQDLAAQLKPEGITLDVKTSSGSIDNLQRIANSKENAALGVVQSDVIAFLLQSKKPESREIAKSLRMVMPLYPEEIHVLARTNINSLADLTGKRVVVGPAGSGSMMTSVNLFSLLDIKPANMFQVDAPEGVVAVMANRADAMIFVGGTPVPMFKNLESLASAKNGELGSLLQDVHFVPLTEEKLKEQYEPAEITSADYSFVTTPVPTMAVRSVLVTYDFSRKNTSYYKARCKQLAQLGTVLREKLPQLQQQGHHAKWQQVKLDAELAMWQRDACVWPSAKPVAAEAKAGSDLEKELLSVITGSATSESAAR